MLVILFLTGMKAGRDKMSLASNVTDICHSFRHSVVKW